MPEDSPTTRLQKTLTLAQKHGIECLVIGGQEDALMGSPRPTYDVDLCYRRTLDNIRRLTALLQEVHATLRGVTADLPFRLDARTIEAGCNFTFNSDLGDLDLLGFVDPIGGYDALVANAERYDLAGLVVHTIALDDLIRVKQHIARFKDSESLVQLLAIKRGREQSGLR